MNASPPLERELTQAQRSLPENCFEEGQYDAAISALDDIRSPKSKPYAPHIRQLIYIALYPPPSVQERIEEEALKLEPGSPSKILSRRHKSSLAPSPLATAAAQDLLMKFARTNAPDSLASALPSYPNNPNMPFNNVTGQEDSYIAQQALRICNARCCWEIIKEGFIQRGDGDVTSSPRKTRTRRSTRTQVNDEDAWEAEDSAAPAPVSDHAWSVLDWMLTLFESDEAATERAGQGRYSPLLLTQIPPSRPETAPRWDMRLPLDVTFHALQQGREMQRSLGVRLLALLINLTSTTFLDFPMFLNAVSTRVSSLPIDPLSYLLASLPVTRIVAQFKVVLCRHALGGSHTTHGTKPKPQARARAQPRRRTRTANAADITTDGAVDADVGGIQTSSAQRSNVGQGAEAGGGTPLVSVSAPSSSAAWTHTYPAVTASDVLTLLARPNKSDPTSFLHSLCLKSELVTSFGLVQLELGENDRDPEWLDVVRDGRLRRAVEDAFVSGPGTAEAQRKDDYVRAKKDVLLAIMSMW